MTTYTKHLSEPWFTLIKLGLKTCEGRLNKGDFARMKKGDVIRWQNNDFGPVREFETVVRSVKTYPTFKKYLSGESLSKCLPGIDTLDEGLAVYFKYYTVADEAQYKIRAIRLIKK
jgi:ASC-1-like (ASCH) protein